MQNPFFQKPILNSPYGYPQRHWELDEQGQPTQRIIDNRRKAEFISPIPRPRKQKGAGRQAALVLDQGQGLSTEEQQYNITALINGVRAEVDQWRGIPNPADWRVTPETARLLQHWRHHAFSSIRPFFCQIEAVETASPAAAPPTSTLTPPKPNAGTPAVRRSTGSCSIATGKGSSAVWWGPTPACAPT